MEMTMNRKYKLALRMVLVTSILVFLKAMLSIYVNFSIELSALFLSLVGGAIFLIGFMLAGVSTDYKESEKLPSEIASYLENMYEEGRYVKSLHKKFDLGKFRKTIISILSDLKDDIESKGLSKKTSKTISGVHASLLEMERIGVPKESISKIKGHVESLRKCILRIYYIKGTSFVPAAYAVLEILTGTIIAMMLFVKLGGGLVESLIVPGLTSFFLLYMTFLIKDMDDPFDEESSYVAIDLFILHDLKERLEKE